MIGKSAAWIVLKRSISLSKTHVFLALAIAANGMLFSFAGNLLGQRSMLLSYVDAQTSLPFLVIPFMTTSSLALTIPVVLLFVYDKNNGVLEKFLSLGMNQAAIYKRYLKAALLLVLIFLPFAIFVFFVAGWITGLETTILLGSSGLVAILAISIVTLVSTAMMSFSSLQKERIGANQPVGVGIGGLVVLPNYIIPFVFPADTTMVLELVIGIAIGAVSVLLLFLSSRLIKREKLLP